MVPAPSFPGATVGVEDLVLLAGLAVILALSISITGLVVICAAGMHHRHFDERNGNDHDAP